MENKILEKTLKREFYRKQYYKNNKEKIINRIKEWRINNKEKIKKYQREYMKDNRPISFSWSSIKNWRLHPKFFCEEKMFTLIDLKYIWKNNDIKYNKLIEEKAIKKYGKQKM